MTPKGNQGCQFFMQEGRCCIMSRKLTDKQKKFVEEYLIDLNATQAAIRAGYKPENAQQIGSENLSKLVISEAIQKAMNKRSARTEITQDMVLNELAKIAFSNGSDFAKVTTKKCKRQVWDQESETYVEKEVDEQFVELIDTDKLSPEKKAAIAEISEGKFGISVKSCDKVKALELLGKHLGMFKDKVEVNGNINNPFEGFTTEQLMKLVGDEDEDY